ncbi:MAG: exodeoxyribonuclease VII small subunit [Phycisphaerae bacterium]|nr:exodeoxyribonuclease VII small subunit [Phycisphaerae bacterium]
MTPRSKDSKKQESADPVAGPAIGGDAHDRDAAALSYEDALAQLEAIIDRVEHGDVGIEQTLDEYRKGRALLRRCQAILDTAEQEIKRLSLADVEAIARAQDRDVETNS